MNGIVRILMGRDGYTQDEAERAVRDARDRIASGHSPEEVLLDEFGLEPDYVMDLL